MEVPKEILEKWKVLRSPGDAEKIVSTMAEDIRVSDETVRRVFTSGKCNDEVFKAIADFYDLKSEMIKVYL